MNANGYYRSVSDSDDTDYDGATLYMRMPDMLIRRHIMPRHRSIPWFSNGQICVKTRPPRSFSPPFPSIHEFRPDILSFPSLPSFISVYLPTLQTFSKVSRQLMG